MQVINVDNSVQKFKPVTSLVLEVKINNVFVRSLIAYNLFYVAVFLCR